MRRFNPILCIVGGCTVALLALGAFIHLQAGNADAGNNIRAAAYLNADPTGCTENCAIIDRSQMRIAALNSLAAH